MSIVKYQAYRVWQYEESQHKTIIECRVNVSIHSDDPAYFGCLNDNYFAIIDEFQLGIDENDIVQLATNAIGSSFLSENEKSRLKQKLEEETVPILRQLWIDGEMKSTKLKT